MKWLKAVQVGDIVRSGNGTERVVRAVRRWGNTTVLTFSILRCSWTERCYTIYFSSDLKTLGYRPTGKRTSLKDRMSRKIHEAVTIHRYDKAHRNGRALNCCTVNGVR